MNALWLLSFLFGAVALLDLRISQYGSVGPWSQRLPPLDTCNLTPRYLLYGVNPLEGFSMRRKLFLRAAYLSLLLEGNWTLVLPPFRQVQHWPFPRDKGLSWGAFFDVDFLATVLHVIEWEDYVALFGPRVDLAIWQQSAKLNNAELNNETLMSDPWRVFGSSPCPNQEANYYTSTWTPSKEDITHHWSYFDPSSYGSLLAKQKLCVVTNGRVLESAAILSRMQVRSLFLDRLETTSWDRFWGSPLFEQLQKALRYAPSLHAVAQQFIQAHLSNGYLAVHIRAGDFVHYHPKSVLTLQGYATRLRKEAHSRKLSAIFVATNMDNIERKALNALVPCIFFEDLKLHPGQVAIVDQLISVNASHFIGTRESFFTSTIQDERNAQRDFF